MELLRANSDRAYHLWNEILEVIKSLINARSFELWFSHTRAISFEDDFLIIEVPDEFYLEQLKNGFEDKIRKAIEKLNLKIDFKFVTADDGSLQTEHEALARKAGLHPQFTFENFAVGRSNEYAYRIARLVANRPGERYNPLFIWGKTGVGKTHLLHAIGNWSISKFKNLKILYTTAEEFTNRIIYAIQKKETHLFKSTFRNLDMLLIDDFQFFRGKKFVQMEIIHTIDNLLLTKKQIVIASAVPLQSMKWLDDRARSRLQSGIIAKIGIPDLEIKKQVIDMSCREFGLSLNDEIIDFLARSLKLNNRELNGAIARLAAFISVYDQPLSVDTVKSVLHDLVELSQIHVDDVLKSVSKVCRIRVEEMLSKTRRPSAVFARKLAAYVMSRYMKMPITHIAEVLNRTHPTVHYMLKKAKNELALNNTFRKKLKNILNELKIDDF